MNHVLNNIQFEQNLTYTNLQSNGQIFKLCNSSSIVGSDSNNDNGDGDNCGDGGGNGNSDSRSDDIINGGAKK